MTAIAERSRQAEEVAYTTAGLATMGACPKWDGRVIEYLGAMALENAASSFGTLAKLKREKYEARRLPEAEYGKAWLETPEGEAFSAAFFEREIAAEKDHSATLFEPYEQAAIDLACTPAPSLQAALFKVQLIKWEKLDNHRSMKRDPMEVVAEDFASLAQRMNDPVAQYHRALDSFIARQINEAQYSTAMDALDEWAPATPTDLLRKFLAVFSDGASPHEARIARLMEQAGAIFDPATGQRRTA